MPTDEPLRPRDVLALAFVALLAVVVTPLFALIGAYEWAVARLPGVWAWVRRWLWLRIAR